MDGAQVTLSPDDHVKRRYPSLTLMVLAFIFTNLFVGFVYIAIEDKKLGSESLEDSYLQFAYDLTTLLVLLAIFSVSKLKLSHFKKDQQKPLPFMILANWTLFIMAFSIAVQYLANILLSYAWPEFVETYLLDRLVLFPVDVADQVSIAGSIFMFLAVVICAPLFEEIIFRGLLLGRLTEKYSRRAGIILSSILFAVLHVDPIGAFVFAAMMCLIYLYTGSIWATIFCHFLNNFIYWLFNFLDQFIFQNESQLTIAELQSSWSNVFLFSAICIVWLAYFKGPNRGHDPRHWLYAKR